MLLTNSSLVRGIWWLVRACCLGPPEARCMVKGGKVWLWSCQCMRGERWEVLHWQPKAFPKVFHNSAETESISQTSGESTEACRQNFEDPPNNQDQDIVQDQDSMQEQIQEQIQQENEISICKFYIKKCCKHGLRGNNCNYPHPALCKKIHWKPWMEMRTRMHQLPPRYLQIFYAIQKVLQREMLQNSP